MLFHRSRPSWHNPLKVTRRNSLGDDYRYRFDIDAKRRFIDLLHELFNSGVEYKGRNLKWDTIVVLRNEANPIVSNLC